MAAHASVNANCKHFISDPRFTLVKNTTSYLDKGTAPGNIVQLACPSKVAGVVNEFVQMIAAHANRRLHRHCA